MKPKFRICFRYTNPPLIRPDRPYLIALNEEATKFRCQFYGMNGIKFNKNCEELSQRQFVK